MSFKQICDVIFRVYLYALSTKKVHYSTDSNHGHKLSDEIYEEGLHFADDLAEEVFGFYGKPKYNDMKIMQDIEEVDDLAKICQNLINAVEPLRTEFAKNEKLSGIVSLIDDFKGVMAKEAFLATFDRVSNTELKK